MSNLRRRHSGDTQRFLPVQSYRVDEAPALAICHTNREYKAVSLQKHVSETTALKTDTDLKLAEKIIVVMGPTGVGKSRFIKEATQLDDVRIGHGLKSGTQTLQAFHFMFQNSSVALVDTPGFDDTYKPDTLVFRELAAWLAARYQEKTRLTAIIYIQRITDTRVSGSILRNLMVMKRMLGVESFPHLTLVTSMWDVCEATLAHEREDQLKADFWKDLVLSGAKTGRFWGNQSSAFEILEMTTSANLPSMTIQSELVDRAIPLEHTSAGAYLDHEIGGIPLASREGETQNIGRHQDLNASWDIDFGSLWLESKAEEERPWGAEIYDKLLPHQIRVLQLFAGSGEMPPEVSLVTSCLKEIPPFAAMSYVVGKALARSKIHLRQGMTVTHFSIPTNLQQALVQLRRPHTNILIWIDALCINQEDHHERAEQVTKMFRIYQQASHVCIWLGLGDEDSNEALDLARRVLDFEELERTLSDPSNGRRFAALAQLMSSPWFSRRWCVQEIMVAKEATIHCGKTVMPWRDFVDVVVLLSSRWEDLQEITKGTNYHVLGQAELVGAVSLIQTSQEIFWQTSHGEILERLLNLEALLCRLASFEVTVLHDAVYAVLELACDVAESRKIKVDYSMEVRELFGNITEFIVKSSGSLDFICRPWAPQCGLPSWITTTSASSFHRVRAFQGGHAYTRQNGDSLVGAPGSTTYRACGNRSARGNVSFHNEGSQLVLSARGIEIGELSGISHECVNGIVHGSWRNIAGWMDTSEPVPDAFWRALVADRTVANLKAPTWYKRACESAFRKNTMSEHLDTKEAYNSAPSTNIREFLRRVQSVTWSRKLGEIKVPTSSWRSKFFEPRCSCPSKNISTMFGKHSPSCAANTLHSKAPPPLCLCPTNTALGDKVCVLYGCSVPVVLRPVNAYYILIGECFVPGIMDGEAVPARDNSTSCKVFSIV